MGEKNPAFLPFLNVYFIQLHKILLAKGRTFLWLCVLLTLHCFAVTDPDLFFCFALSKKLNNGLLLLFSYYRDSKKKKKNWTDFSLCQSLKRCHPIISLGYAFSLCTNNLFGLHCKQLFFIFFNLAYVDKHNKKLRCEEIPHFRGNF